MRIGTTFVLYGLLAMTLAVSGCGGKNGKDASKSQKSQSQNQGQAKPIDSELQHHMKIYQDIKKSEYQQTEKVLKEEKKQLQQLQKTQAETLRREMEFQEKVRQGTDILGGGTSGQQSGEGSQVKKKGTDQSTTKSTDQKSDQGNTKGGKSSSGS